MSRRRDRTHALGATQPEPRSRCGLYVSDLSLCLVPPERATCDKCREGMGAVLTAFRKREARP